MEKNPWENDFTGMRDGHKEFSDSPRPNQEALNEKRDEYLVNTVNHVLKNYDQTQLDLLCKHIDKEDAESKQKTEAIFRSLILRIRAELMGKSIVDITKISSKNEPISVEDKKNSDALKELEATYPEDMIREMILATLEVGYF